MKSGNAKKTSGRAVLGAYARVQIMEALREALKIVRSGADGKVGRLREIVGGVLERIEAADLPAMLAAYGEAERGAGPGVADSEAHSSADCPSASATGGRRYIPATHLSAAVLAAAGGEPVREFLLIPFGSVTVERPVTGTSFEFTRVHAEAAVRWFDRMGRKLALDYEHQSFEACNPRPDGLRPAAGWIGGLEVRDDGLWAVNVTWTARAAELLRAGEYRYFSPVIYWGDEDQRVLAALGPVALTNDPAMHGVQALAARRADAPLEGEARGEGEAPAEPSVATCEGGKVGTVQRNNPSHIPTFPPSHGNGGPTLRAALDATRSELEALRAELAQREAELAGRDADEFVERGLRAGKIVVSTRGDWRADYLRDPAAAEARLSRAPVLLPPGRLVGLNRAGEPDLHPTGGGTGPAGVRNEAGPSGPAGVEAEDVAAYERAAAAGRVVACGRHGPVTALP